MLIKNNFLLVSVRNRIYFCANKLS